MQLVERIFIKENDAMDNLCRKQTAVYNQALWCLRQEYFNNDDAGEGFLTYYDLNDKAMLKWKSCYREAIPGCAANTIQRACDAWKAYWKALKTYLKDPSSFTGKPKMPHYTDKNGKSPAYFTYAQFSIKDHHVIFPAATNFDPIHAPRLNDQKLGNSKDPVKQVRVIPAKNTGYWIECVYNIETSSLKEKIETIIKENDGILISTKKLLNKELERFKKRDKQQATKQKRGEMRKNVADNGN